MLIHRDGWRYSGRVPEFFPGSCGACCTSAKGYHFGGYALTGPLTNPGNEEYDAGANSWASKAAMPAGRGEFVSMLVGSKAYAAFGTNSSLVAQTSNYEYVVDTWATKTSGPSAARRSACGSGNSTDGYVCGGNPTAGTDTQVDAYSQSGDSWTGKTAMTTARGSQAGMSEISPYFYVCGGNSSGSYIQTVERYDPSGDSWASKTSFSSTARGPAGGASTLASKIYISGGIYAGPTYTTANDEYTDDTWTSKTGFTGARVVSKSITIASALYAVAGQQSGSPLYLTTNQEYSPDSWTSKNGLPNARYAGGGATL